MTEPAAPRRSIYDRPIRFVLENKLVVVLLTIAIVAAGAVVAPFDWDIPGLERRPVPVDAIPDYGENQQVVFTEWMGRSPNDVEDQVTYPLTVSLLGIPRVRTIRSYSDFGYSSIYVIFEDGADFDWSRDRVTEKITSLPQGLLPDGVRPALGPYATPLGQVFWYTLEGRDAEGAPAGGWDLEELRAIQDWQVRYALASVDGIAEVASIGGFVKEYQIDVDPDALRAHGIALDDVFEAVTQSNIDVGARTIEVNRVEYVIRSVGFLRSLSDIEETVVAVNQSVPIRIRDVAKVVEGPAERRGALDKDGQEAVGGVVVARYGANPLTTIAAVKAKIEEIASSLPVKTLANGTESRVAIVPFYDRTGLIHETLGTLESALAEEILVTIIVVLLLVFHLRSSILISAVLPVAVLICFMAMKAFGIDANVVALSGIAIAIGTLVDMGIVLCENILRHLDEADPQESRLDVVHRATVEVAGAVVTAVATTLVSFLPVFTMEAAEGKLFKPLAYTKTFALLGSIVAAILIVPPLAQVFFTGRVRRGIFRDSMALLAAAMGVWVALRWNAIAGAAIAAFGVWYLVEALLPERLRRLGPRCATLLAMAGVFFIFTEHWRPLGHDRSLLVNGVFVGSIFGAVFLSIFAFQRFYESILRWCLAHKAVFLAIPIALTIPGFLVWLGAERLLGFVPSALGRAGVDELRVRESGPWRFLTGAFPGLGKEFMPKLTEGSFLYMPSTMPHASIGESMDALREQDVAIRAIPEIDIVVGKLGRVDSALDPAPVSMVETVVQYKPEYIVDRDGRRRTFRWDGERGEFTRDDRGELIEDPRGRPFRQWRDHIRSEDDIWSEIERAGHVLGSTSAPKLQPIETRLIMLQTGMRAAMGVKVFGPDLAAIEKAAIDIERLLRQSPGVVADTVVAERVVGKPYLEIHLDRKALARHGIPVRRLQDVVEIALGGRGLTMTVEGRERYAVRVRYLRELRDSIEDLERILIPAATGIHVPLAELAHVEYRRGPMVIKSEDTRLVALVTFDKQAELAEVDVVEQAAAHLQAAEADGRLALDAGVAYRFSGNYENQVRAVERMMLVVPISLFLIFLLIYFQFRSTSVTFMVASGILLAWSGGFILLGLYGKEWFLDFSVLGVDLRDLFHIRAYNLSVAVWVGFLALFGIASDDGVIMGTYLEQSFARRRPRSCDEIREAVVAAGKRRIRACMMTEGTTILALIPVLTSTGRGADIMVPMAIPTFGGMMVSLITVFIVPTLYCLKEERALRRANRAATESAATT